MDDHIDSYLHENTNYPPPRHILNLPIDSYETVREKAQDIERYWREIARQRTWIKPFTTVKTGTWPEVQWFADGTTNITLDCLDRHQKEGRSSRVAFIALTEDGQERHVTYQQLTDEVDRVSRGLKALGVSRGDRVIIYMPLILEGIVGMLACARIGAIHSVVYAGLGHSALRTRVVDSGAKIILAADITSRRGKSIPLRPIVERAMENVAPQPQIVMLQRETPGASLPSNMVDWDAWFAKDHPPAPVEEMNAEDPLFILYTSGTTGSPKGAVFVHGGYSVGTPHLLTQAIAYQPGERYWCMSDIGWIVGHSMIVYGPLISGMTTLIREGAPDYPSPGTVWDIVEKYQINKIYTAPTVIRMLRRFGEQYAVGHDLSSLKMVNCAGEPLNPEAWLWFYQTVGKGQIGLVDNWWQTETAAPTIGTWPTMNVRPGRAGFPFPGAGARIVDSSGNDQPADQGGQLLLTEPMPQMFRDVFGHHERYLAYFNPYPGYYLSGDVATRDQDGYIEVIGRADDVLNVAGHRIGTADVESALVSHHDVAEAGVIGIPDPLKGESIIAYLLLRNGAVPSEELEKDIISHVRQELGPIATPAGLRFPDKLPKTRSGKIMRRLLKAWELGQDPGDLSTLEE